MQNTIYDSFLSENNCLGDINSYRLGSGGIYFKALLNISFFIGEIKCISFINNKFKWIKIKVLNYMRIIIQKLWKCFKNINN